MAKLIYPHPNPPYLKDDGTLNISGRLELYDATNTSTAKIAYSDADGTPYGSVIDLDSTGRPENGPIYWEGKYHIKVFVRDDDNNLSEQYTVDDFGEDTVLDEFTTTSLAWTVDGVGGTSTTFASLSAAMNEARNTVFIGNGELTITVGIGIWLDDQPNLEHPQGEKISIVAENNLGVVFQNTTNPGPVLTLSNGFKLKQIEGLNIQQHNGGSDPAILIDDGAQILDLNNVTARGRLTQNAIEVKGGATVRGSSLKTNTDQGVGLLITEGSKVWMNGFTHTDDSSTGISGSASAIKADGLGSVYTGDGTTTITGDATDLIVAALFATNHGGISTGTSLSITNAIEGIKATIGGKVNRESVPTFTTVTTNYTPSTLDTITSDGSSITTGNASGFTIISTRHVSGMNISIDSGDTDHDLNVTAGVTLNHDFTDSIELGTALTKQIDAAWAAGDDAGGWLSAGALPTSGGISIFAIKDPSTGAVDVGFDKGTTLVPTLPTGYTKYRYLGWALLDGSDNLRDQLWKGEYNLQYEQVTDISDSTLANGVYETGTSTAPPDSILRYGTYFTGPNTDFAYDMRARLRPVGSNFTSGYGFDSVSNKDDFWYEGEVNLDSSQQFEYEGTISNGNIANWTLNVYNQGWIDLKRNNP